MRSSVYYGPQRDIIGELMEAAKTYQPHLRRGTEKTDSVLALYELIYCLGTYFSMPEWYNPAYAKYSWEPYFPGGPPKNPYTGQVITYTGYVEVDDFVKDIQLPQMRQLAYDYETDIMWCDVGGANNATIFAAEWLNWARDQGRQVTFNNRCGLSGDFDTPEYVCPPRSPYAHLELS